MKLLDKKIAVRYLKNAALIAAAVILFNVIRGWVRGDAKRICSNCSAAFSLQLFCCRFIIDLEAV